MIGITILLCRLWAGGILAAAAVAKIASFPSFKRNLTSFGISSNSARNLMGLALITVEFFIGGMLIAFGTRWAAWAAVALFAAFAVFVATNLIKKRLNVKCGCFGAGSGRIGWRMVTRNLALMGFALLCTETIGTVPAVRVAFLLVVLFLTTFASWSGLTKRKAKLATV
jgi:putative oxidoreductase